MARGGGSAAQNCLSVCCRENSLLHRRRPAQAGYRMRLAAALAISASVAGAALLVYTRRQRRRARALRCQPCDSPRSPPPGAARARRQSPDALQAAIAFDGVDTPVSRQTTRVFDRVNSPQTIQARCSETAAPKPIGLADVGRVRLAIHRPERQWATRATRTPPRSG